MHRLLCLSLFLLLPGCSQGPPGEPHDVIEQLRARGNEQDWDGMLALVAPDDRRLFAEHLLVSAGMLAGFSDTAVRRDFEQLLQQHRCSPPARLPTDGTALQKLEPMFPDDLVPEALARGCLAFLYRHGTQHTPGFADGSLHELRMTPGGAHGRLGGSELSFVELDDVWFLAVR